MSENILTENHQELENILYSTSENTYKPLFQTSSQLALQKYTLGKITVSNHCIENCNFCSCRKDNPFNKDEIQNNPEKIHSQDKKFDGLVIESAVLSDNNYNHFQEIYKRIHLSQNSLKLYLDVGLASLMSYPEIIDRTDDLFIDYIPVNSDLRLELNINHTIHDIQEIIQKHPEKRFYGNIIIDIPGQDFSDIITDLQYLIQLPIHGIKISPFIPQKNTPLTIFSEGCLLTTLKVISLFRIFKPQWDLFIDSYIEQLSYNNSLEKSLEVGANYHIKTIL